MALPSSRWLLILGASVAALFTLLFVYVPVVPAPYQFDDQAHILFNRAIRYLDNPRVFFETMHQRERPLTNVSFALNYAVHGLRTEGYRWVNIFLHFANAFLFGLLLRKALPKFAPWHWAAAFIFLLHPLAVDAVTYISGRSTLLVLFFSLLAGIVYCAEKIPPALRYSGVFAFGLAAFLSKESGAVLPLWLVALGLARGMRWRRGELAVLTLFFVLAFGFLLYKWSYLVGAWSGTFRFQGDVLVTTSMDRLLYWLSVWWQSLRLFVDPRALAIDHAVLLIASPFTGTAWLLYVFFLASAALALVSFRRGQAVAFLAVLWFFVGLVPTHSIVPVLDPIGERNMYLALPGACLFFAWLLAKLPPRPATLAALALCGAMLISGALRKEDWRSHVSIWRAAHALYPQKLRITLNYANALVDDFGDHRRAFGVLAGWMEGNALEQRSYEDQKIFLTALQSNGIRAFGTDVSEWPGHKNLFWRDFLRNEVHRRSHRRKEFLSGWGRAYENIRKLPPPRTKDHNFWRNRLNLQMAGFLLTEGNWRRAKELYEEVFSQFAADELPYWIELQDYAKALRELGEMEKELAALERLAAQYFVYKIYYAPALTRIAEIYEAKGDWLRASDAYGELIRTAVDDPKLRKRYGRALERVDPKRAEVQRQQYAYFAERRVPPADPREWLSN